MSNPSPPDNLHDTGSKRTAHAHWRENIRLMVALLSIWFAVSYLLGIVFVEPLNQFHLGGFPVGFWFAQQGSIFVFIVLAFVYAFAMDRIDQRHRVDNSPTPSRSKGSLETGE